MSHVNDDKLSALGGTSLDNTNDLEIIWLQGQGATSDNVNDAWMHVFELYSPATPMTGTLTVTAGTKAVVGVGTLFTTELVVGDKIIIAGELHIVAAITDNLNLDLAENHIAGAAGVGSTLVTQRQYNDAAFIYLGSLGHNQLNLTSRWSTFWAGALP